MVSKCYLHLFVFFLFSFILFQHFCEFLFVLFIHQVMFPVCLNIKQAKVT